MAPCRLAASTATGRLFKVNTNGSGFYVLHSFPKAPGSDGAKPYSGLLLNGNTLYGTTQLGGTNNSGTVFKINTNGGDLP